ncbi:MAG: hypothetical protein WCX95_03010, partial [Candidatus Gracilibacteria bacterium]
GCILGPRDEKQAFIDATVEATCHIFKAKDLFDPAVEKEAKEIYKKYGFDADNQESMQAIAAKYAEDAEVKATIMDKIKECSEGVPGLEGLTDEPVVTGDDTVTDDGMAPVVKDEEATEPVAEAAAEGDKTPATLETPVTPEPAVQ